MEVASYEDLRRLEEQVEELNSKLDQVIDFLLEKEGSTEYVLYGVRWTGAPSAVAVFDSKDAATAYVESSRLKRGSGWYANSLMGKYSACKLVKELPGTADPFLPRNPTYKK